MTELAWNNEGRDWPNRAASTFVNAGGMRWHVQRFGVGPPLLLVHGTGASTHSWRDLAPILATRYSIVAPDLPGHGFTQAGTTRLSLDFIADALHRLLDTLDCEPRIVVGHSAGAAVLAKMALDRTIKPDLLVSLNGALLPLRGMPGPVFSFAAKALAVNPLAAFFFAWRGGQRGAVERLLASTGSSIDARGVELYARLFRNRRHVAGVLGMMASWNLDALARRLGDLPVPLLLIVGENDRTIAPSEAVSVRARVPHAQIVRLAGLGHLAHEEDPAAVAAAIVRAALAITPTAGCAATTTNEETLDER